MKSIRLHTLLYAGTGTVFSGFLLFLALMMASGFAQTPQSPHHIYIAFGFHGNLYHSFRNDTNDECGFGKDIRVIRHIIATMDRLNQEGIEAKAVWDFDNLFSLQEILPQHAPDIIENIRRRIARNGDEAIVMSYNNGLASAMTETELTKSVGWAISNPWNSGVQDVFGTYSPIVRPQEMMTTPGNFSIYKQFGIQAVALYYSATPFDAFRVFSRPLTHAEAHNPILYRHPQTGEEMVVIPSYHIGDLVEHVSLRHWVEDLRALQEKGELNQDALIFINFDADSDYWSGVDLPWALEWLPNTDGLGALVREVQDLPYVRFSTLSDYLQDHPPVGTFYFSQDTADGSFNGYNSWAEKARVSPQWTQIERSRRLESAARKSIKLLGNPPELADLADLTATAELVRLRLLSTTHFGMATPFVTPQREQAVSELIDRLDRYSDLIEELLDSRLRDYIRRHSAHPVNHDGLQWLDTFLLLQTDAAGGSGGRFLKLKFDDGRPLHGPFVLETPEGRRLRAIDCRPVAGSGGGQWLRLYVPGQAHLADGLYHLYRDRRSAPPEHVVHRPVRFDGLSLSNGIIELRFDAAGRVEGVYLNGVRQAEAGSLMPYVRYNGRVLRIRQWQLEHVLSVDSQSATVQLRGTWPDLLPGRQEEGLAIYTISMLADCPFLFLQAKITYPQTDRNDIIKADAPGLTRRADMGWREVAPAEIRLAPRSTPKNPVRVLKRNYLGVETQYALDYFRHDPANLNLDNVNNHITESYVGILSGGYGLVLAMDTTVQANFAFAPLKMTYDPAGNCFHMRANPFGTYHGSQYRPPKSGNGQGYEMTLHTGEHLASAAPTYNGIAQEFELLMSFFKGDRMSDHLKENVRGYAHPPMVVSWRAERPGRPRAPAPPLKSPEGFSAAFCGNKVLFFWEPTDDHQGHYRIFCGTRPGVYKRVYAATGSSLQVAEFARERPFKPGQKYFARIEAVSANGSKSSPSKEISFRIHPPPELRHPSIPLDLKVRVLWSNIRELINDFLL